MNWTLVGSQAHSITCCWFLYVAIWHNAWDSLIVMLCVWQQFCVSLVSSYSILFGNLNCWLQWWFCYNSKSRMISFSCLGADDLPWKKLHLMPSTELRLVARQHISCVVAFLRETFCQTIFTSEGELVVVDLYLLCCPPHKPDVCAFFHN
jgi:hypothetical protein